MPPTRAESRAEAPSQAHDDPARTPKAPPPIQPPPHRQPPAPRHQYPTGQHSHSSQPQQWQSSRHSMHPHSPVSLPTSVFDDSSGLRNRLYWSQLIVIGLVTPLSFVLNKLWTFAAVRGGRPDLADPLHEEEVLAEERVV